MFLPLIIIGAFSQFSEIGYDDMLGSTPVSWPEQWATGLVGTDSNHYDTATELYLYFGVNSVYDLASGVVEAYFPDDDTSLTCSIDNFGSEDYTDYVVTCDVENYFDAAGTYGPIHLVVRESADGQILAEDTAFWYVALIDAEPTEETDSLTVEYDSSDPVLTVSADASLSFSFALSAGENIYRGDYFELTLDASFSYEDLTVTLNSSTNAAAFPDDGALLSDGLVYLIGLTEDLSGDDNANFTFTVSGFSNPSVVTTGDAYYWSLKVWRYGTPTLLKYVSGTGPADDIVSGSVSVKSWAAVHSAIKVSTMYDGLVTYMTLTLSADHDIPAGGEIEVVFKNVILCSYTHLSSAVQALTVAADNTECAVVLDDSLSDWAIASITTNTITLTVGDSAIAAGTSFKVTNLVEITSATIGITSITTSDGTDNIDEWDEVFADLTLTGNALVVTNSGIYTSKTSNTGINTVGTTSTHGFGLYFTAPVALTSAAYTITVYAPIVKGVTKVQETNVGFPSSTQTQTATANDLDISTSPTLTDITSVTTVATGSITIKNPAVAVTAADEVFVYLGGGAASADNIYLPGIVTFLKNTPQVVVTLTVSTTVYSYAVPWRIVDNTDITTVALSLLCANFYTAGAPAKLTITPDYDLSFTGYTLKVNLLTNLDFTVLDTATSTISVLGADNDEGTIVDATHLTFTVSKILNASPLTVTLPLPTQTAADSSITVSVYVVDSNDDETLLTTETAATGATAATATAATDTAVDLTATSTDPTTVSFSATTVSGTTYNWAILYSGTRFDFSASTLNAGDIQVVTGKTVASATSTTISSSVSNPWYDSSTDDVVYLLVSSGADYAAATCSVLSNTYSYVLGTAATFGTASYTPAKSDSYTYDNTDVDIQLTLPISGSVYIGAVISIVLDSAWTNTGTWTVTLGGTALTGSLSTYTWTSDALTAESSKNPSLVVKVAGLTLPELTSTDADQVNIGFNTVTITYDVGDDPVWTQTTDDATDKVATTIAGVDNTAFTISEDSAWIFPDLKGSADVYFGISFSTKIDLAEGDEINIDASFSDDADVDFNTWSTIGFDSVSISGGVLTLVLDEALAAGDVITIVKDLAFTPDTAGDIEVTVTVTRDTDDIVSDTTTFSVSTKSVAVSSFSVETSNAVPGFSSIHTFTVQLDTALDAGSCLVFDASSDYNIALGDFYNFEDYGDDMFLWAEDGYFYQVKHWVLEYVTMEDYAADTDIVFSVEIFNPSASGSWSVYVTDVNMTFVGYGSLSTDLTFDTSLSNDIDVYFATPDFSDDLQVHSLTVETFIDISATAESVIQVAFPAPYSLEFNNGNSVSCSLYSGDTEVTLSSNDCPVDGNMVTFTLTDATTLTSDAWTTFTFEDLITPKWGFWLNASVYEYDDSETWTGRFCLFYNEKDADVTSLSFDNLNGAYFGFEVVFISTFTVNGGETIVITPGTYSGTFTIEPVNYEDGELSDLTGLLTESVVLTGEIGSYDVEGTIELSDGGSYTLDFLNPTAEFWVGAAADCPEGMYYIKWSIDETQYDGYDNAYGTYLKTKLQVSAAFTYQVSVEIPDGSAFFIPSAGYSFPYRVSISQDQRTVAPYDDITFIFSVDSENVTVTFYPEDGLVISALETEAYIYASCDGCVDGEAYDVIVDASDNSGAFVFTDFSVTSGSAYDAAATFDLTVPSDSIVSSGFQVLIENSDSYAIVTWCIISLDLYNETLVSYDYLLDNTYNFGSDDTEAWDFEDYVDDYMTQMDAVFEAYDTYEEMAIAILKLARNVFWIGQSLIDDSDSQELYDFTGMLAFESDYSVFVYVDNYWGGDVPSAYVDVTTDSALKPCQLSLSGDLDTEAMTISLSQLLGLPTYQIDFGDVSSRRRLGDATVTLVSGVTDETSTAQKVDAVGVDAISSKLGVTVTNLGELSPSDSAEWVDPLWTEVDDGVLEFNFTASADGYLYCVVEVNSTYTSDYDSDSIRFGLDRNGDDAYTTTSGAAASGSNYQYTFNFTESGYGVYDVACVACDDYPLTPTCSSVSNYTYDYAQSSSGAFALVFAAAAYLLI